MTDTIEQETNPVAAPAGWQGILDPGEHIVWQGRPTQAFRLELEKLPLIVFGLFFTGFAVFWMAMASRSGGSFWMFGMIHFTVGMGLVLNAIFGATIRRRATWYTLTDRRAFIATDLPWKTREIKSFPIARDAVLDYRAGPPATIYFDHEIRRGNKGRSYRVDIGFERIADGERVLGLMRAAQSTEHEE